MKHRKTIINVLVITLAFLLFIIWNQNFINDTIPSTTAPLTKNYDIYLITADNQDEFWQYLNDGAEDMAALTGVNYYWRYPEVRNPQKQVQVINEAINKGADALLVAADDTKKISGAIEDAKAKGIQVIYVDAPANEEAVTTLSTNNYKAGLVAGQKMISYLKSEGIENGSIGILSFEDRVTETQREAGFRDALANNPEYEILPTVNTQGKPVTSQLGAEKLIIENKDLVGLFGTNEGISAGLGNANKKNNNKIFSIGFDKSTVTKKLYDEGSLSIIIEQNPYTMGYVGMAEAIAAVLGKNTGPSYFNTGFTVLEKEQQDLLQ